MLEVEFESGSQEFSTEFSEAMEAGGRYNFGKGLDFNTETRTLSVDCADVIQKGDSRPISAAAVWEQMGNIEAMLKSI